MQFTVWGRHRERLGIHSGQMVVLTHLMLSGTVEDLPWLSASDCTYCVSSTLAKDLTRILEPFKVADLLNATTFDLALGSGDRWLDRPASITFTEGIERQWAAPEVC